MQSKLVPMILTMLLSIIATPSVAQDSLPANVTNAVRKIHGDIEIHYLDHAIDLNGDGQNEIVLYLISPMLCGTGGCNLLVLTPHGSEYKIVADTTVTQTPIQVASASTSGWRDLIVHVAGGGSPAGDVQLKFDGKMYPRNPTLLGSHVNPATLEGSHMLIADFNSIEDTKLLPAAVSASVDTAPSFDCVQAASVVEKRVCSDSELSALDRKLAAVYAKGLSADSEWPERDKDNARAAQRNWLAERERCGKAADAKDCIKTVYQHRIAELQIQNADLGPVPTAFGYRCKGIEAQPVFAVFYQNAEPPAMVLTIGDRQVVAFIARSGSGARYTAKDVEFWEHHGEATIEWFGNKFTCQVL